MRSIVRYLISRWIPNAQTSLGRLIRWPLLWIPSDMALPVLTGPNRGHRWIVDASVHGCWIGSYERQVADRLADLLAPGDVFYDLGANAGYYTLLASGVVGPNGQVVAFEPLPRNVRYLRRHVALNGLENVRIEQVAVVADEGPVCLGSGVSPSQARVDAGGHLDVRGVSLDSMVLPSPDVLKIDVEGAELLVLRGAAATLRAYRPRIVLSTHGEELRRDCYSLLESMGYQVEVLDDSESDHVALPDAP